MEPAYARLIGQVGTDIKKEITITRKDDYPFNIIGIKYRNGKEIEVDLKEFNGANADGYVLTIANKKAAAGRYADSVILTTDSTIKPTITVPVYGQIISPAPQPEKAPSKKDASDE